MKTSEKSYDLSESTLSQNPKFGVPKHRSATIGGKPKDCPAPSKGSTEIEPSLSFICINLLVSYVYLAVKSKLSLSCLSSCKLVNSASW